MSAIFCWSGFVAVFGVLGECHVVGTPHRAGGEPKSLPNPPPQPPLVGRRRRATVTFGPEWLRVARTACSPRGLGTSLVTAWP